MKRTISILVIVAMMLASLLAIVPVSAADPEGTPIKNAKEFAAMEATGTYYLANDITITKAYAEFKGTLDGNGHTISVNGAPSAFTKLSAATVSNLTVKASANTTAPSGHVGALAGTANGVFTNVHAVVDYTYTDKVSTKVAGLIGELNGVTAITDCTAKGSINIPFENTTNGETSACGGLVAFVSGQTVSISKCVNYVNIVNMHERTNIGGILGQATAKYNVTIDSCANYGTLTSTCSGNGGNIHCGNGGIVGQLSANGVKDSAAKITNSRNYGDIHTVAGTLSANKDKMSGGILGRIYGSDNVLVEGCVNSGNIDSAAAGWGASGGIVGQAETYNFSWSSNVAADIKVNNCLNLGKVDGNNCAGIFGSTAQVASPDIKITISNCANYGEIAPDTAGNGGGMLGATCDVANGTYTFINCYNAGKVSGAGIISKLSQAKSSSNVDETLGTKFGAVTIEGCINVGEVTTGGLVGGFSGGPLTIKASANTFADVALAPESESITITEAPEDAAAAAEALLATLPALPTELDAVVLVNLENEAVDYIEGWEAFKEAFDAAFAVANKASNKEEMDAAAKALNDSLAGLVLNTELDFYELDIAISEADEVIDFEDDYLASTWAVFQAAYEAANACAEAERQSQINKAAAALLSALDALELKPDFEALDAALAQYSGYVEAEYTTKSWAAYTEAYAAAQAYVGDETATGGMVNEAIANLKAAVKALGKKVDTAALKAKVEAVTAAHKQDAYTATSYNVFNQTIRDANDFIKSGDVSQAEIDALIAEMDAAIAALLPRADLTELKALIEACAELVEENYTAESWTAFKAALDAAQAVTKPGKDSNTTVETAAALLADLEAAKAALVGNADYTAIDALIAELAALKEADYTADSWKALQDAIAAVAALKADTATTAEAVDAALAAINAAKGALVAATVDATETPTDAPTDDATEPAKSGCGGFIATSVAVVAVVSVLGTAVALKKKED